MIWYWKQMKTKRTAKLYVCMVFCVLFETGHRKSEALRSKWMHSLITYCVCASACNSCVWAPMMANWWQFDKRIAFWAQQYMVQAMRCREMIFFRPIPAVAAHLPLLLCWRMQLQNTYVFIPRWKGVIERVHVFIGARQFSLYIACRMQHLGVSLFFSRFDQHVHQPRGHITLA